MHYSPATDILHVKYPDVDSVLLPIIKESLAAMVQAIINYDVKRLLLDASKTVIKSSIEENRSLTLELASHLSKTRLQKVARIQPVDPVREKQAQANINHIQEKGLLSYQLGTFATEQEAMEWLLA
ncbi:hypothetical protein [Nibribacter koreensis]